MPESKPQSGDAAGELSTIRDFLRWGLSEFRAAKLSHGHGTTSAIDEAAFLILETLHLPINDINPWLDAKLLTGERQALAEIIRRRIERAVRGEQINDFYICSMSARSIRPPMRRK